MTKLYYRKDDYMALGVKSARLTYEQMRERSLVLEGLKQVESGEVLDFDEVICQIESQIMDAILQN